MYIPKVFEEKDKKRIIKLVKKYAFGTLVTCDRGVPFASHLPMMIEDGDELAIYGHMAKENPQWSHFEQDRDVLAIFQGPHAYISPSNYKSPIAPTWNYASVHMYGKCSVIEDEVRLRQIIESLSNKYEECQASPWVPEYPDRLLKAIVGFELVVKRIEAKYKLSQNRPEGDRKTIISNLSASDSDAGRGVAELMKENEL